jgi:8-hydroxy-5-deazaflavin:NADPH oxidoreductase
MKIAVLGTGEVGQRIASKLVSVGHEVTLGSRTRGNEKAVAWANSNGAREGTFADAASGAEIVFNCTKGDQTLSALEMAGADNLADKVLVDISNPLDFSRGFPPSLSISNTDSLGEAIQRAFPRAKVVKALNTMSNPVMVDPRKIEGTHHTFVCGNDAGAKDAVRAILESFGWRREEVVDLGDITNARGTEAYILLWVRIYAATKTADFNVRIAVSGA